MKFDFYFHLVHLNNTYIENVIIVNGWKPLPVITKSSTLDVAAALDPPLLLERRKFSQGVVIYFIK